MASQNEDTQSIALNDPQFQEMLAALEDNEGTATLSAFNEVLLLIDGMIARLVIRDSQQYFLGRFKINKEDELDLRSCFTVPSASFMLNSSWKMRNSSLSI